MTIMLKKNSSYKDSRKKKRKKIKDKEKACR